MSWAVFRAPGIARASSPGIQAPAAALPSTTAAVLAAGTSTERTAAAAPAGPLPRTGRDAGASTALAVTLILAGTVLRRTGRLSPAASY